MKYNIADFIRSKRYRENGWNNDNNYASQFCKKYSNSICSEYYVRNLDDKQHMDRYYDDNNINYKLLDLIIKEKTLNLLKNNELRIKINDSHIYIHLRIGDVIDKDDGDPNYEYKDYTEYLNNQVTHWNGNKYVYPLKYYENILTKLKKLNNNNITIVAHNYDKDKESNSYKYTMAIHSFFFKHGYNTEITYNDDADVDFILLCNANFFVPSGGGYSILIKKYLLQNNKQVLHL